MQMVNGLMLDFMITRHTVKRSKPVSEQNMFGETVLYGSEPLLVMVSNEPEFQGFNAILRRLKTVK